MPNPTNEQDFTELFKRVNEDVSALRSEVNRLTNIVKRLEAVAPTKADVAAAKRAQPDRAAKTAAVPKIAEEVKALNEEEAEAAAGSGSGEGQKERGNKKKKAKRGKAAAAAADSDAPSPEAPAPAPAAPARPVMRKTGETDPNSVFVGNLPASPTRQAVTEALKQGFAQFGGGVQKVELKKKSVRFAFLYFAEGKGASAEILAANEAKPITLPDLEHDALVIKPRDVLAEAPAPAAPPQEESTDAAAASPSKGGKSKSNKNKKASSDEQGN